ncbi:MAG: serine/threonine protein kinase [Lentisphaerae bacterium]|nr:serine/threonine protein kinase [Lentisphaerota bacterium]
MFCHHCHYEFYVPGDTLGAKIRCPNCTGTLRVEDKQLLYPCPECGGMLDVALWMIGSVSTCPHCQREITLSLGEESCKFFPGDAEKESSMLRAASKKAGEIIGKYRVIRCLGIGGMGEVYLVEHTLLNTRCALKLLKSEIARQDPEMRARLLREARLASQIQHPNLIAVLDAELDENSDSCYIVMEYVDGVSIENILADGPMLEQRSLEIISSVAEALREAALHKIIHRDIKPANIMLSSTGEVKLADLGIAKVESDNKHNMTLTMDNAVLGTPNYASPEQLRSSHRVDSRADIYSLGATLYHMLTGKRPFEAESVFGVMANVLEKDIPPVHSLNPAVSVRTSDLIARMMAKKRENRPADFDELLKELQSGKRKFHFPKIGNIGKLVSLRNIWSFFLGVVAIAGLCVAGTRFYWYYLDRQKAEMAEKEEQVEIEYYRRPLVRPGFHKPKRSPVPARPVPVPVKTRESKAVPVEKTKISSSNPMSPVLQQSLIQALRDSDIQTLKKLVKEHEAHAADLEICLNFSRAVLRLDYARCYSLAQKFKGDTEVSAVLYDICLRLARYWERALMFANMAFRQRNNQNNFEKVVDIIGYLQSVRVEDLYPDISVRILNVVKNLRSREVSKSSSYMASFVSMLNFPLTLRRNLNSDIVKRRSKNYSFVWRIRGTHDLRDFQSASAFAAVFVFLDNGHTINDELMDKMRSYPQFDDFTGESATAYDYSMMNIDPVKRDEWKTMPLPGITERDEKRSPAKSETQSSETAGKVDDKMFVEFDFGNLSPKYKKEFIPDFLDNGVLSIDGLYPASLLYREKHGANAKKNEIKLDKALGDDFTVSMVFYPLAPIQSRMRRRITPLLVVSRMHRVFVLQMDSDNRLKIVVNNHHPVFKTDMAVEMDKWNSLQVAVDSKRKICKVILNGNSKEIALGADFKFNVNASRKEVLFYNYSNGGAFRGMVKYLRLDYKALNGAELTAVSRRCGEEINNVNKQLRDIAKNEAAGIEKNIENLKKALRENNEHTIRAMAREISAELKEKIKQLCELERYDECEKLLKACNAAQRAESSDYWDMIGNVFYERYCEAMKNSDNRKVENIYNAWRWANRTRADRIHIVYTSFEYQFLRMNYRIAGNILDRDRSTPEKVRDILKERLNKAANSRKSRLLDMFSYMCNSKYYWVAKDVIEAMYEAGISDRNIHSAKRRLRDIRNPEKNPKKSELRAFTERAVRLYDVSFWRCLNAHDNVDSVMELLFREIESYRGSNIYGYKKRLSALKCMLTVIERNKFPDSAKDKLTKIPELADFVLKK